MFLDKLVHGVGIREGDGRFSPITLTNADASFHLVAA
jgi:hypothetical protein